MVQGLALSPHNKKGYEFTGQLKPFCVEFACSPSACVGSLQVDRPPPTIILNYMFVCKQLTVTVMVKVDLLAKQL